MRLKVNLVFAYITFFILVTIAQVNSDDPDKKDRTSEKLKLARSSQKKQVYQKPSQKPSTLIEKIKSKKDESTAAEPEGDNSETERLCLSVTEESVPDFLTKFGLITHLIQDVNSFRAQVKASRSRQLERASKADSEEEPFLQFQKKNKVTKNKMTKYSTVNQRFSQNKNTAPVSPKFAFFKSRQSKNQESVPTCFGYEYLSALDAYDRDTDSPDIEMLQDSLTDMLSMKLTSQLSEIFEMCSDKKDEDTETIITMCPIIDIKRPGAKFAGDNFEQTSEMRSACEESCFTDSDCGSSGERCCPNDCGGHSCHSPRKWLTQKQRSVETKCGKADAFMQCLYDQIKEKVCSSQKKTTS